MRDFNPAWGRSVNAGRKVARPSEARVMLAIGQASVLRGARCGRANTTRRKRRRGEERPSEGHASAQSLVRSQTNRRPAHAWALCPDVARSPDSPPEHVCTPPHLGRLVYLPPPRR